MDVIKHTRFEERELRSGRISSRVVTTWDVVKDGQLISEHRTQREALAARYRIRLEEEAK